MKKLLRSRAIILFWGVGAIQGKQGQLLAGVVLANWRWWMLSVGFHACLDTLASIVCSFGPKTSHEPIL